MRNLYWMLTASICAFCGNANAQNTPKTPAVERGKMVYVQNCLACHQADGSGVPGLAPPLIEGSFVSGEKTRLIEILLNGMQGVEINGEYYANPMPAFDYLSDTDIADVLTYIRSNFKNKAAAITETDVKKARELSIGQRQH